MPSSETFFCISNSNTHTSIGPSSYYIPAIERRLQDLTCLHSDGCPPGAEWLWEPFRSFAPLWTSFHLLWTAFAIKDRAVLKGEDVLYEERGHRFDCVRHLHPVIHQPEASQGQRATGRDVVEAVCVLTHSHALNLYKNRGGFTPTAPAREGGGPTTAANYCSNFHLFACSDQLDGRSNIDNSNAHENKKHNWCTLIYTICTFFNIWFCSVLWRLYQ